MLIAPPRAPAKPRISASTSTAARMPRSMSTEALASDSGDQAGGHGHDLARHAGCGRPPDRPQIPTAAPARMPARVSSGSESRLMTSATSPLVGRQELRRSTRARRSAGHGREGEPAARPVFRHFAGTRRIVYGGWRRDCRRVGHRGLLAVGARGQRTEWRWGSEHEPSERCWRGRGRSGVILHMRGCLKEWEDSAVPPRKREPSMDAVFVGAGSAQRAGARPTRPAALSGPACSAGLANSRPSGSS